ncbi:MAG: hypothetical protein Q8Q09_02090 [Deltaproteobacteria bacterium]|nr:hypothetical protein [Deltaproteobacteria bacterium]
MERTEKIGRRLRALTVVLSVLSGVSASGCARDIQTQFPMGLEPIEDNTATLPTSATEPTPETLTVLMGTQTLPDGREYSWVHARGYIRAPLARVWSAMRNAEACADRREVTEFRVTPQSNPAYVQSWSTHNIVRAAATVIFDVEWRHGLAAGTEQDPQVLAARWQKVRGSSFIELMRGSASAQRVSDTVTEVSIVYHLGAFSRTPEHAALFVRDLFGSWVAVVHDQPLPTYR